MRHIALIHRSFIRWMLAAASILAATSVLPVAPAHAAAPSFDCKKAEGQVQELVCGDAQLSALDREVTRLFALAQDGKPKASDRKALAASQQNWMKARENCASATEMHDCVVAGYLKHIMELRGIYPVARSADKKGISLGPDTVTCEGLPAPMTVVFANTQTPLAYLSWADRALVTKLGPTGSGARYIATSGDSETVFWIKGRGAMFTLPDGKTHQCRIAEPK
ncbi:DUF1311 domain-containing protein [Neorhizobium sp. P12A]|uniref:MliC family protein n=1 Tax=Neorhizobium sp. P12A TaxID=2268027 RepID=UPI0011ED06B0|nr:MliC family protein [Neorhizobium sp. P12A]KAA0699850.1 DUF1311 domain-containing protein [Neorhizobium sp. P12A]